MHPIWVIRTLRTAFALRSNRELASNVSHKRSSSSVIFIPFFAQYSLLLSINPQSLVYAQSPPPSLHGQTILQAAIFSYLVAHLEELGYLALVPLFLSIGRLSQKSSGLIESGYPSLCTRWALAIHASLNFSPQRNTQ